VIDVGMVGIGCGFAIRILPSPQILFRNAQQLDSDLRGE
jgi:hypothetical protein